VAGGNWKVRDTEEDREDGREKQCNG